MGVLDIRLYGDPVLRRKAEPIEGIDDEIRELAADMIDTMYEADGVGLAAPQIGLSIRMLVADAEHAEGEGAARVFINPEILEKDGEWKFEEGCLSIPGIRADVVRPERIVLRYLDLDGNEQVEEMHELWARVLQHEIDHLDGKLFIDYLSQIKKTLIRKTLKELEYEAQAYLEDLAAEDEEEGEATTS
jgi:peptide deformylase